LPHLFDESGDVKGLHVGELADAASIAPSRKAARGVQYALRVWSLLIWALKNSSTRRAAFGVSVKSAAGAEGGLIPCSRS